MNYFPPYAEHLAVPVGFAIGVAFVITGMVAFFRAMIRKESINQLCYWRHAGKRGHFVSFPQN